VKICEICKNVPPYHFLWQLACHQPASIRLYLELWRMKDDVGIVSLHKSRVRELFCMSTTRFVNTLCAIRFESLVNYEVSDDGFYDIELVLWESVSEKLVEGLYE